MARRMTRTFAAAAALASLAALAPVEAAEKALTVTTVNSIVTPNPYAHSDTETYFIWCEVYGCIGRLDYITKEFKPMLAEKWELVDPTTWRFTLRRDLVRQDGGPGPTAKDVVHSWKRIMTDPDSSQRFMMFEVKEIVAVDDRTFDIKTLKPSGQIVADLFSQFAITSADLYEKYGRDVDKSQRIGWGPYRLEDFAIENRIVLRKNERWPGTKPDAPDLVVFRQMREPEQRVTALLNNEVQVARLIPPQLVDRLKNNAGVTVVPSDSVEIMFMAFNNAVKPWDDVRVRRAAAYAINRDAIVQRLLFGYGRVLEGALGPAQICYDKASAKAPRYDLKRAKELLAEAGYKGGGPEVEFQVSTGRYISDRQIGEALARMLDQAGFKVRLTTPEWANMWADVRAGKSPAYYMGRGQVADPSIALSQYFETGITPRTKYSSAAADALFEKVRMTIDPVERCQVVREAVDKLAEDVPAHFLWTHQLINGVRANVTWPADPSGEAWLPDVVVK